MEQRKQYTNEAFSGAFGTAGSNFHLPNNQVAKLAATEPGTLGIIHPATGELLGSIALAENDQWEQLNDSRPRYFGLATVGDTEVKLAIWANSKTVDGETKAWYRLAPNNGGPVAGSELPDLI